MITKPAGPWHRLIAALIDLGIQLMLVWVACSQISPSPDLPFLLARIGWALSLLIFIYPLGYHLIINTWLTANLGGSLGKLISGLEVVDSSGKHLSFKRAFFRNQIGYLVSGIFLWLGYVWIWIDPDHRGWHDQIAGSFVKTSRSHGILTGLLGLLMIIIINGVLLGKVVSQFIDNSSVYQGIVEDVGKEINNFAHPAPSSLPLPSPYR